MNSSRELFESNAPENVVKSALGYWRIRDMPTPEELSAYYATQYYQEARGSYEITYTDAELRNTKQKIAFRLKLAKPDFLGGGKLLDVGCGEGFVLAHGKAEGWDVRGLDFSSAGVEGQNPFCRGDLLTGDIFELLENEVSSENTYDVIWLQNVLEHVIDPEDLLTTLKKVVSPSGVLVVTVPNDFSRLQEEALLSDRISTPFWVSPPDHLSYFSAQSLRSISIATGWDCRELIGDFPVDWFLFNDQANYIADPGKGKSAHFARVEVENLLLENDFEDMRAFSRGLARVGMGRDLTAFLSPAAL